MSLSILHLALVWESDLLWCGGDGGTWLSLLCVMTCWSHSLSPNLNITYSAVWPDASRWTEPEQIFRISYIVLFSLFLCILTPPNPCSQFFLPFFFLPSFFFDVIVKMHQKSLFFCFLPLLPQRMVVCTHFHHFLYLSLLIEIVLMFGTGLLANGLSCSILQKLVLLRMHCIMGSRGLFYVQLHLMQLRSNDKYLATDEIIEVSVVPRHL